MNIFYSAVLITLFILGCLYLYLEKKDKEKTITKLNKVKERLDYNFVQLAKTQRDTGKYKTYLAIAEKAIADVNLLDCSIGVKFDIADRAGFLEVIMSFKDVKACYYYIPTYRSGLRTELTRSRKSLWRNETHILLAAAQEDLVLAVSNAQINKGSMLTRDDLSVILRTLNERNHYGAHVDFKISYDYVMIRIHLKSDYSKIVEQIVPTLN